MKHNTQIVFFFAKNTKHFRFINFVFQIYENIDSV